MGGERLLLDLAGYHLIPCLLASCVIWVLVSILFRWLRRPGERVPFLYLSLLKTLSALFVGAGLSCLAPAKLHGIILLRLPNLVPEGSPLEPQRLPLAFVHSGLTGFVVAASLAAAVLLLLRRWARLAPIYRDVYRAAARGQEFPELYQAFQELVDRALPSKWPPRPQLLIVPQAPAPAFTMGVRRPAVVLSRELAQRLSPAELQGIVAHELGHVSRLDYLGRWLAVMLRDIMIWNPIVVAWYDQLERDQERAADEFGARLLADPGALAAGLVEVAAHLQEASLASLGPRAVGRRRRAWKALEERLRALEEIGQQTPMSRAKALLAALLIAFLLAQPQVALSFPNLLRLL
jgi:Zn-dependent protease with chaperone function